MQRSSGKPGGEPSGKPGGKPGGKQYAHLIHALKHKFGDQLPKSAPSPDKEATINISETDSGYRFQLALPGCSKEDLSMKVDRDILMIKAEQNPPQKKVKAIGGSPFQRSLLLPADIRDDAITAFFENEILHIFLPKGSESAGAIRNIAIQ